MFAKNLSLREMDGRMTAPCLTKRSGKGSRIDNGKQDGTELSNNANVVGRAVELRTLTFGHRSLDRLCLLTFRQRLFEAWAAL